jgi:hypothetical protein
MFEDQDFRSANMLLGISDEALCIQSLRHLRDNGLGQSAQYILNLPVNATIEQVVARVEEYAAQVPSYDQENAAESVEWLKQAAAKV